MLLTTTDRWNSPTRTAWSRALSDQKRPADTTWSTNMATPRPVVVERGKYEPQADQEQFMVTILRDRVERSLGEFASSPRPGARVLDVGCGRRPFGAFLEGLGYRYFGLDVNQNPEETVDFVCAIDERLPSGLANERFDLIICLEVLEHVAAWDVAWENLAALLAPGGALLVTCPHFYPLHEEPYDFWRPTPHALSRFASSVGLVPRWIEMAGGGWDVFGTALTLVAPRPVNQSVAARVAARVLEWSRGLAFRALRAGWPQRLVTLDGPLYLSNIGWFDKPPEGTA